MPKKCFKIFFRFIKRNRIIQTIKYQKTLNLVNQASNSKFVTRKWNTVNDHSNQNYDVANEIIYNIEVLKSNLCDCNRCNLL